MKRTKLSDRTLPSYTLGEEIMNTVTHALGGVFSVVGLVACILLSAIQKNIYGIVASSIYGASMIALYCVSSVYHGIPKGFAKKVMQVIDHCTIYFLIAGTYTIIALCALRPVYPAIAWGVLGFVWLMAIIAAVLTAIDLEQYKVFSMVCYIGIGWAILPFFRQIYTVLTLPGFLLLLFGGLAYTVGAILYGLGKKRKWMHSVFHIFVVLGTVLQFFCVFFYVL